MSKESLDYEDLRRIIELVDSAPHVRDIRLKADGIEIELRKQRSAPSPRAAQPQQHVPSAKAARRAPDGTSVIKSSLVGTFRRADLPGGRPFVEIGDRVTAGTTVCMVEVLGELNPIHAGMSGIVLQLPLDDGASVEFGQTLAVTGPIA